MSNYALNIKNNAGLILSGVCLLLLVFIATVFYQTGIFILAGIIGLVVIIFAVRSPKIWLRSLTLLLSLFLLSSDKGVSVIDVLLGIYFIAGLYAWLIYMTLVRKIRLIENKFDWLLLFYYFILIFNAVIAVSNNVDIIDWLREYSLYSLILLYFPLKHYLRDNPEEIKVLLLLFAISSFIAALYQFYFYFMILKSGLEYAYQLLQSSRINQLLFTVTSLTGFMLMPYLLKKKSKALLFLFSALGIVALILTFSRIFWVAYVINLCFIFLMIPRRSSLNIIAFIVIIVFSVLFFGRLMYKNYFDIFLNVIESRAVSSSQGTKDISLKMRLSEWSVVQKRIKDFPMGGNGLNKSFRYYDPSGMTNVEVVNIHNSYLFMAYRIGIPLSLVFLVVFFSFTIKAAVCTFTLKDIFYRNLAFMSLVTFLSFLITNNFTAQFFYREGIILMAYSFAFTTLTWNKKNTSNV